MMNNLPTHKLTSLTLKSGSGILQEGGNLSLKKLTQDAEENRGSGVISLRGNTSQEYSL